MVLAHGLQVAGSICSSSMGVLDERVGALLEGQVLD